MDLEALAKQIAVESHFRGDGADEERKRIVAYMRQRAENSEDAETLNHYANLFEAGEHWEDLGHDED